MSRLGFWKLPSEPSTHPKLFLQIGTWFFSHAGGITRDTISVLQNEEASLKDVKDKMSTGQDPSEPIKAFVTSRKMKEDKLNPWEAFALWNIYFSNKPIEYIVVGHNIQEKGRICNNQSIGIFSRQILERRNGVSVWGPNVMELSCTKPHVPVINFTHLKETHYEATQQSSENFASTRNMYVVRIDAGLSRAFGSTRNLPQCLWIPNPAKAKWSDVRVLMLDAKV